MNLVNIKEHQKLTGKVETLEEKDSWEVLKSTTLDPKDQELISQLEKKILTVSRDINTDQLNLKAHSSIGVAQFTNFTVKIGPKFSDIHNTIKLIEFVNNLDIDIFPESEIEFPGELDDLSEIIISSFLKKVQILLKQGMVKTYNSMQDNLPALRGKLLLTQQFQNDFSGKLAFACEYDELEYNNLENQIIFHCLKLSSIITKNKIKKQKLNQLIQIFSNHIEYKKITKYDLSKINYNQMNHHYKKIHADCELILNSIRISDFIEKDSGTFTYSFFVNMDNIFEKFVYMLFDDAIPNQCTKESTIGFTSEMKYGEPHDIVPDISINDVNGHLKLILDMKYKDDTIDRNDRFQLSMYAVIKQKNDVYAILPKTSESKIDNWNVTDNDIAIHVRYIDINQALDIVTSKNDDKTKMLRTFLEKNIFDNTPIDQLIH